MSIKTILVKADTELSDLKVGDLVMTAELHKIVKINNPGHSKYCVGRQETNFLVVDVLPHCDSCGRHQCKHEHFKWLGWGQHCLAKVLKITKDKPKRKLLADTHRLITVGLVKRADKSKCCNQVLRMSRVYPHDLLCGVCGKKIRYEDQIKWHSKKPSYRKA